MITITPLSDNLKALKSARRLATVAVDDADKRKLGLSTVVVQTQALAVIDQVLDFLKISKSLDSSTDPVLSIHSRIIKLAGAVITSGQRSVNSVESYFIGTSLVVRESVLLPRTFAWPVAGLLLPTTNASAVIWSTSETARAVTLTSTGQTDVSGQLLADVGRLLDSFAAEWQSANK